jgi:hypothetical protein
MSETDNDSSHVDTTVTPSQLYHYTGKDSFLGIIKNKCFWASHILFQNDHSEMLYTCKLLKQMVVEISKNKVSFDQLDGLDVFAKMDRYTVSFSEDGYSLNQFRAYTDGMPGYAIGFRPDQLKVHLACKATEGRTAMSDDPNVLPDNAYHFSFVQCIYDPEKQQKIISDIVSKDFANFDFSQNDTVSAITGKLIPILNKIAPMFKDKAFAEEKEWRLVIDSLNRNQKIHERPGKTYFIPYYELDFCNQNCIGDVIIGHCQDEKTMKASVSRICENHGIEFIKSERRELKHSEIPYRNW